jgi:hypothetical protein
LTVTGLQRIAWRLQRQHLVERAPAGSLVDVTSELCGLHAQLMSSAELTAWARVKDLGADDVARALWDDRSLVKLWAMRGTLHLLSAETYPTFQLALATISESRTKNWLKLLEMTQREVDRVLDAIRLALVDQELTREELAAEVAKRTRSKAMGERVLSGWGSMLKPGSFLGDLCFAPSDGRNVRFTNPYAWLGVERPDLDPEDAARQVGARFLAAYGPVTREEYQRWWGALRTPLQTERFLASIDGVAEVDLDGAKAFMLEDDVDAISAVGRPTGVRLLPAFDLYVVTARRNDPLVLDLAMRDRVYRKSAWFSPVLLVNGRMEGVWKHEKKGKRVIVTVEPFAKVTPKVKKGAVEEAERLAAFLGGTLDLSFSA